METKKYVIELLESKIISCDALGGMEREKAAFQNALKEVRRICQRTPKLSAEEIEIIAKVTAKLNRMDAHLSQHFTVNRNFHEEINESLQSLRTILHNHED